MCCPVADAALSTSLIMLSAGTGLVGLTRRAIRVARGTISCSTPSRLAPSSDAMKLMPVIFPPGVAEASHDAGLHRIGASGKDDWNSGGRRFCRQGRCGTYRGDNDPHLTAHQIGCQFQEPVVVAISPAEFDRDGTALGITSFTKALSERREETSVRLG